MYVNDLSDIEHYSHINESFITDNTHTLLYSIVSTPAKI